MATEPGGWRFPHGESGAPKRARRSLPKVGSSLDETDRNKSSYLLALVSDESYRDSGGRVSTVSVCW